MCNEEGQELELGRVQVGDLILIYRNPDVHREGYVVLVLSVKTGERGETYLLYDFEDSVAWDDYSLCCGKFLACLNGDKQ